MDPVSSYVASSLGGFWVAATREDPAQDQLRMVIIGLVVLAGGLIVAQVVFWRITSPRRQDRLDRTRSVIETPSTRRVSSSGDDAWTAPAQTAAAPLGRRPMAESSEVTGKIPLPDLDMPWPPARVSHRGSARGPRPPDPPGSLFDRLSAVADLDLTPQGARSAVTIADRPAGDVAGTAGPDRSADSLQ